MRILGIDPGSRVAGYGIVEVLSHRAALNSIHHIEHGLLKLSTRSTFQSRIHELGQLVNQIIKEFNPNIVVIEKIFIGLNVDSAFKLGHARGVCIYEAMRGNCQVAEYTPREVKKSITGKGQATKEQVSLLIRTSLGLDTTVEATEDKFDATDALALAYHHATQTLINSKLRSLE